MAEGYESNIYRDIMPTGTYVYTSTLMKGGDLGDNNKLICLHFPVPLSTFSSITCDEFRPTYQSAVKETNPFLDIGEYQIIVRTASSSFDQYVGRAALAKITFA